MLLKKGKKSKYTDLAPLNSFVIVNVTNFSYFNYLVDRYNFSHNAGRVVFKTPFDFFSGNNYFALIGEHFFYDDILELMSNESNFELLAICYNNHFMNFDNNFFNMSNTFFIFFYCIIFYIFFSLNLFFSKFMTIYKKVNFPYKRE